MPINSLSNLLNFKSTLDEQGGPANPARFMFVFGGFPNVLKRQTKYLSKPPSFLRSLQFLCEATDLPGLSIHTNQRPGYSPIMTAQIPAQYDYQPVNLTILCRDYMTEKEYFDDWMFSIRNMNSFRDNGAPGATYDTAYYNDIIVDAAIFLLSNNGNVDANPYDIISQTRYAVRLSSVYPTSCDSIQLSWSEESLMRLSLTLTYNLWEPIIGATPVAQINPAESFGGNPDQQLTNNVVIPRNPNPIRTY